MLVFPNAKINIGLNIVEKRFDGFHNIETVFYPIGLSDVLEINYSNTTLDFKNTGLTIENGKLENNLCYKAYQLLKKDFPLPPIQMHLHKIIPFGAGLGGGSSDASFTLHLLNKLFELNLTDLDLLTYAELIGSDCPFFIFNQPAFASEKGNKLDKIQIDLKDYYLILVNPEIHINTAQAYSQITPKRAEQSLFELIQLPVVDWKNQIKNDFEDSVFRNHPEIKEIKEHLYKLGAVYASMSGSGSSVYGIFSQKIDLGNSFANQFIWREKL